MLRLAIIFFVAALIAGFLGFGGISAASAGAAQIAFFIFVALMVLALTFGSIDNSSQRRNI